MAVGRANSVLVLRPVDINIAIARIRVLFVQPFQPENTARNPVLRFRQRITRLQRHATLENRPARHVVPDFPANLKASERRLVTARLGAQAEARTRDGKGVQHFAPVAQSERLASDGNVDVRLRAFHNVRAKLRCGRR